MRIRPGDRLPTSFTDHMSAVLADDRDVESVFTFDVDDFETPGFTAIPEAIEVP